MSEFAAGFREAEAAGLTCMPHSPCFGPGHRVTIQLPAVAPGRPPLAGLYVAPAAMPDRSTPRPEAGAVAGPRRPGIGFEPDRDIMERFSLRSWART